jgi:hypothetical protein
MLPASHEQESALVQCRERMHVAISTKSRCTLQQLVDE